MDENVSVPRALLSLCFDLLQECDKHTPIGSNFDDDLQLAGQQLKAFLDEPAAPASPPSSVGEEALAHAFRNVDGKDWDYLFANLLNDSGHGKFWKAVMHDVRCALSEK